MNQTAPLTSEVSRYVAQVRAALGDLPPEEVDDLLGGLEADLAERAGELPPGSDLTAAFGTPQAYAAELRSAADLPPRAPAARRPGLGIAELEARMRAARTHALTDRPWLRELLPVWWVVRGGALGGALALLVGLISWALIAVAALGAVASFAWSSRRTMAPSTAANRATILANVLAALAVLPVAATVLAPDPVYVDSSYVEENPSSPQDGVWVNGEAATNLYAYDEHGTRLDRVRLFNQYGQAVTVSADALLPFSTAGDGAEPGAVTPEVLGPDGQPLANPIPTTRDGRLDLNRAVFPLRWSTLTGWQASLGGWEPPVQISELAPTPTPSASPTPSPSSTPSATPTSRSTSTPTARPSASASARSAASAAPSPRP